jgi:hypothetical protein
MPDVTKKKSDPQPGPVPASPPAAKAALPDDLERCPRCGLKIEKILWGKTDCPNCGLHFECC